eukprot:scaffold92274_cov42-Phaeocystis_antarctica.AAC.1
MRAIARPTRHTSRLFFRPNSPMSFISLSRRSFSKGRRGERAVLPWFLRKDAWGIARTESCDRRAECYFPLSWGDKCGGSTPPGHGKSVATCDRGWWSGLVLPLDCSSQA